MFSSSRVLKNLKILSIAGMLVNTVAFVVVFIILVFTPDLIKSMTLWVTIFVTFSIGVPMYAILYASLKNREYLRDILNK